MYSKGTHLRTRRQDEDPNITGQLGWIEIQQTLHTINPQSSKEAIVERLCIPQTVPLEGGEPSPGTMNVRPYPAMVGRCVSTTDVLNS